MAQLIARPGSALFRRAPTASRASSNRRLSSKLVVKCYINSDEDNKKQEADSKEAASKAKVTFQLPHHVEWGQDMCLIGEADELGGWDVSQCVPMAWHEGDVWTAEAELPTGTHVEYKYIVRGGEDDKGKEVIEWQPCNNLELALDVPEVTVRDAWEGAAHEVLPGSLPIPIPAPPAAPEAAAAEAVAAPVAAAAAAPALVADAEEESSSPPVVESAARRSLASIDVEAPVLTAEEIAAAAASEEEDEQPPAAAPAAAVGAVAAPAAAAAPAALNGNGASKAASAAAPRVLGPKDEEEVADPIRQVHKEPVTPGWLSQRQGSKNAVVAAPTAADSYTTLATTELKEMCKQRGLSVKGQRKDLLTRLQQHKA